MRKISLAVIGLLIVAMFAAMTMTVEARFAPAGDQYDRQAVINEAEYAVTGVPYACPVSNTRGNWNYMASDTNAQQVVVNKLGGIGTNAGWTADGILTGHPEYGFYQSIGRGGQCLFEANLLLYRSGAITSDKLPSSWASLEASVGSIDNLKAGDVIFKPRPSPHAMIAIYRSGDSVGVVDSNFGLANEEILAFRWTSITWLRNNNYKVYTGVDYINYN